MWSTRCPYSNSMQDRSSFTWKSIFNRRHLPCRPWTRTRGSVPLINQIPQPPVADLIPHGPVVLFGLFNLAMLLAACGYLVWATWRTRSALPLAFLLGGC